MQLSGKNFKEKGNNNPISSNIFCADPCCLQYKGRLYVYGTSDNQQFELSDSKASNTYEKIKQLVCFSTTDMTNWTYHGSIDVEKIAPWIVAAWAPSVIKREEKDGLTHFYLYFSNSGCGVGVLTSLSPLGPWVSPLKKPLINYDMKALRGVPNPFDPGVCLDDKGDAYLVCGGGPAEGGDDYMPGSVRLVKLGKDLISFDSDFIEIKAPYFFEASEIYFKNGYYVYIYNSNWVERKTWNEHNIPKPSACSMCYMISKTPLISESWKYKGQFFQNPGEMGFNYSNNHVYLTRYKNHDYIFYHSIPTQNTGGAGGGYRSICVDDIFFDEENLLISKAVGTRKGVEPIGFLNPFENITGSTMSSCENIKCEKEINDFHGVDVTSTKNEGWIELRNVDFGGGVDEIFAVVKGKGYIDIYLDSLSYGEIGRIDCNSENFQEFSGLFDQKIKGVHDFYFVFRTEDENRISLRNWTVK